MSTKTQNQKLTKIDLPADVFDVEGAYVMRKRRIPAWKVDAMRKESKTSSEVYEHLADFFPEWHGVIDVDTGEALPNPSEDASVFGKLDSLEQLPWLAEQLKVRHPNG